MKWIAAVGVLGLAAFVGVTWVALEWSGVARVETRAPAGTSRTTHVWFAQPDGELWLEAGTPENPWYTDVLANAELRFESPAVSGRFRAEVVGDASGHPRIRALLREKYGWRDAWVGMLVDTSRSLAVRLIPVATESP